MTNEPASATRSFAADYEAIRSLGPWLSEQLPLLECPHRLVERTGEIELALHELAVNTIDHALGTDGGEFTIELRLDSASGKLVVRSRDAGVAFDTSQWPDAPESPQVRGYGLMIIEQLAENIVYRRVDDENEWIVTFAVPSDGGSPSDAQAAQAASTAATS